MTKTKAPVMIPKERYDRARNAVRAGLVLLEAMEKEGALRLPFSSFPETMAQMRAAVGK